LYSAERGAAFHYWKGWNWRAYLAYVLGIVPCFPGLLTAVGVRGIGIDASRVYTFALPIGIVVAAIAYWGFNIISPPPGGIISQWSEPALDKIDILMEGAEAKGQHIEAETV
jgi:nucleobase:cation symporter-1, NCS1 family